MYSEELGENTQERIQEFVQGGLNFFLSRGGLSTRWGMKTP